MNILIEYSKRRLHVTRYVSFCLFLFSWVMPSAADEPNPPQEKVTYVSVSPLPHRVIDLSVESYGLVEPQYETSIISQVDGIIVSFSSNFVRGGYVKKDEILAKIGKNDYQTFLIEAEAELAEAKASLEMELALSKVAKEEWKNITNVRPSDLGLRAPQLSREVAKLKGAEAALKRAQDNVDRTTIRAPYDGLVADRTKGLGVHVSNGTILGKILGTKLAEIRLPVSGKELQYLINGGIEAEVFLYSDFMGAKIKRKGKILRGEGLVDNKSRLTYLVAGVEDPYSIGKHREEVRDPLRYGTYVTASISGKSISDVGIVPGHLIRDGRIGVLSRNNTLKNLAVDIYRYTDEGAIIRDFDKGLRMITSSIPFPVEGMPLRILDNEKTVVNVAPHSNELN